MRTLIAALIVALPAAAQAQGLPVSCDTVRQFAPFARTLSAKVQRDLAHKYHISRSMIRQARACLK